jgi:hypothetical protein
LLARVAALGMDWNCLLPLNFVIATVTNSDGFEGASMGNCREAALVIGIGPSDDGEGSMRMAEP